MTPAGRPAGILNHLGLLLATHPMRHFHRLQGHVESGCAQCRGNLLDGRIGLPRAAHSRTDLVAQVGEPPRSPIIAQARVANSTESLSHRRFGRASGHAAESINREQISAAGKTMRGRRMRKV